MMSIFDRAASGCARTKSSTAVQREVIRSTVAASNSSVRYWTITSRPPRSGRSQTLKNRSNTEFPVGASCTSSSIPGSVNRSTGLFCRKNATWNRGCPDAERSGFRRSTTWWNGRSWCSYAAMPVSRACATRSTNRGSPEVSVRITRVLTKNPTSSSSASSVRPAMPVPIAMSVPAP